MFDISWLQKIDYTLQTHRQTDTS